MRVSGAPYQAVTAAAQEVKLGVTYKPAGGYGLDVRIHPVAGGPFQARDPRDRFQPNRGGVGIVCIHGYEAFIEALLERAPNATVRTSETTYRGLDDFDGRQDELMVKLGGRYAHQECDCA